MKRGFTSCLLSIFSGLIALSGIASNQSSLEYIRELKSPFKKTQKYSNHVVRYNVTENNEIPEPIKTDSEKVEVNITFVYDHEDYIPNFLCFHDNEDPKKGVNVRLRDIEDTFTVMIPKGSYWVNVIYRSISDTPRPQIHLIKEDVTVENETSLTLDASDATNLITFKPIMPDGEEAVSDLENTNGDIVEQGNVIGDCFISTVLYEDRQGSFSTLYGGGGKVLIDGEIFDYDRNFDIMINPVSTRFWCTCVRIMTSHEGNPIVTDMGSYLDKSCFVSNDPSDYHFVENTLIPSCNNDPDKLCMDYGIEYVKGYDGKITGSSNRYTIDFTTTNSWIGLSDLKQFTKNTPSSVVFKYFDLYDGDAYPNNYVGLSSAPYTGSMNTYSIYNYSDTYYNCILSTLPNEILIPFQPNPVYSHTASQFNPIYGNTVPFVSFLPMITYSPEAAMGFSPNFNFAFVGMNGEVRGSDKYAANLDVKYEGNSVFDSMKDVNGWCWGWFADGANRGKYDISVIDENMKVYDMIGRNSTEIHFDTSNQSDYMPPLLTWMQYRDMTDFVTTTMKEKNGARLFFSAGDFEFHCDEEWNMWFTCREEQPTVKVEYAPHGSDEFAELTVTERPEDFLMPGFGFQYEVALDQVTRKAQGGWFDLRISLADAAGNNQTQTMAPAFKLEDQAGIESMHEFIEGVRVEGNNIVVPDNAAIYTTEGIRTDGINLQSGIYIVRAADRALKLRIK